MNLPTRMTIRSMVLIFATGAALSLPLEAHQAGFQTLAMSQSWSDDDGGLFFRAIRWF